MSSDVTMAPDGSVQATATFGPASKQPFRTVVANSPDGILFTAELDGRRVRPFTRDEAGPGKTLTYDEGRVVESHVDGNLQAAKQSLPQKASEAMAG